jgi:putative MATE family efflux protein
MSSNKFNRYLKVIVASLKGEEHDFTQGSLRTAIVLLAIPMILEMMMESVFAVVDIFFVNKLGPEATSIVGLTESVITIVYSIGIGLSAAATAMVARRIGEKNRREASESGKQAIVLGLIVTVLISIPGLVFAPNILRLMGAEEHAIAMGAGYTQWMFGSSLFIIMLFLINGIFRGAGNAAIAMQSLWLANIINIILDPIFIFGWGPVPAMGLEGAAIATVTGRGIGVLFQLYHLLRGSGMLRIEIRPFLPRWDIIRGLVKIASPAAFQFMIASASWIVLAALVARYGSDASAGYQTAIRILLFFILPAWGLSNAAATLVGQNLGAGLPARAEQSVVLTATYNAVFMASVTVFFLVFGKAVIQFFIEDHTSAQYTYALEAIRIMSAGYIFYGIGMVVTQAFNGAGDTRTPTMINFVGFWLFQIPIALLMALVLNWGPTGAFLAIPIAEMFIAIAGIILFRSGRWKTIAV